MDRPKLTGEKAHPQALPNERPPGNWKPAVRVLLFDDQYTLQQILSETHVLGSPCSGQVTIGTPPLTLSRICFTELGLELLLCTKFRASLNLLNEHFDILLLDVDFEGGDPSHMEGFTGPSHLGGVLLGLCFMARQKTVSQVYTAQHSTLRSNNIDYWYLDQAMEKIPSAFNLLRIVTVDRKELVSVLQTAFERWSTEVLPLLDPDHRSLLSLVDELHSDGDGAEINISLQEKSEERDLACRSSIPGAMFDKLLPHDREHVLSTLSQAVCGHQLVRRAFCKILHVGNLDEIAIAALLQDNPPNQEDAAQRVHRDFHTNLNAAMRLFGVENKLAFVSVLIGDAANKCKTHTRMDLSCALGLEPNPAAVVFGLFENPDDWSCDFCREIKTHLLKDKNKPSLLCIESYDLDKNGEKIPACDVPPPTSWGRRITISGDRTDSDYLTINGGSVDSFVRRLHLHAIASTLQIVGPERALNLKYAGSIGTRTRDKVAIELTVHHTPATEPI